MKPDVEPNAVSSGYRFVTLEGNRQSLMDLHERRVYRVRSIADAEALRDLLNHYHHATTTISTGDTTNG